MSQYVAEITDQSFESTVGSATPTLVDFWAPWCGPCRMIAPILERIGESYQGRLNVAKLNVDENNAAPDRFGIQGIPTMILFHRGQMVDRMSGMVPEPALAQWIDERIANLPNEGKSSFVAG